MTAFDDSRASSFADSIDRADDTSLVNQERTAPTASVLIQRQISIPDARKVARCRRLPEYGPRILFFSGGSALKDCSQVLKIYTHHSIHLMTPFDSGGSSAEIRRAFSMLSVGDLRSRLMALSDDRSQDNIKVKNLFSHRLGDEELLAQSEFASFLNGSHALCRAVSLPLRSILTSHLRWFAHRMPDDFDLRGASIGNLIITGCYLEHHRDVVTAIFLIWTLLGVKGKVRPMTGANLHLRAIYEDGTEQVGQHLMGKHSPVGRHGKIVEIDLVGALETVTDDDTTTNTTTRQPTRTCRIDCISAELLASADVLCYPMGSFFGSVLVNLLPQGVGRAIVQRQCPKIYIPNTGIDPETYGLTLTDCIQRIIDMVRNDVNVGENDNVPPIDQIVNFVLVDTHHCQYCIDIDKDEIQSRFGGSVVVLDLCLVDDSTREAIHACSSTGGGLEELKSAELDPLKLVGVLLSLGS